MAPTSLLLVDIQNDYFPNGKMQLRASEQAGCVAGQLLAFFREHGYPVIHIQHLSVQKGATFFLPGTAGAEIHPSVRPTDGETIIQKHFPNSFRETDLLSQLQQKGIQRLVVAGMMTHMCVDATVRAAADYGFKCLVAEDACATRNLLFDQRVVDADDVQAAFLAALDGTYGEVVKAVDIIKELEAG